jgi:hypothetical protein
MKATAWLIVALSLFLPEITFAGLFGASNFYECILDEMPGVKNDPAAREVIIECREDFPKNSQVEKKSPIFGIKTAGECVLEYGKDVASPLGARYVQGACYNLYPKK